MMAELNNIPKMFQTVAEVLGEVCAHKETTLKGIKRVCSSYLINALLIRKVRYFLNRPRISYCTYQLFLSKTVKYSLDL